MTEGTEESGPNHELLVFPNIICTFPPQRLPNCLYGEFSTGNDGGTQLEAQGLAYAHKVS